MATFKPWEVVKVPFPYTDRPVRQHRPALVIAAGGSRPLYGLLFPVLSKFLPTHEPKNATSASASCGEAPANAAAVLCQLRSFAGETR